ncbi:MAG: MYXO-CTERM sorting domain-containing protein [Myxococcota bacterium]|nr:MYXO-CTERM sorting domain-containing protein [Myxococcota bacterium]
MTRAWGLAARTSGVDAVARARGFLAGFGPLALPEGATLEAVSVQEAHGFTVVRFARLAHGGPVLGGSVVVRMRDGAHGWVVDYVSAHRVGAPEAGARSLGGAAAERTAERAALAASGLDGVVSRTAAALEIDGRLAPVWRVDVAGAHLHQRERVIVADDGEVLARHPLTLDALGRVFPRDPTSDMDVTQDVELLALTSRERLTGRYFRVESCNAGDRGCEPIQRAEADAEGNFLYDPEEPAYDDAFAEVHTYHHANLAAAYFQERHDFSWTCGGSTLMRVLVNYTEGPDVPYDNAAYSPTSGDDCGFMLFGQGASTDFSYDADVVYHELTHGIVDGIAGLGFFLVDALGLSYDPGAVNEGTADYFAATISGDPLMAEYFMGRAGSGEGALRRLDNDLVCPDDLVGESHFDGRIWAGFGWEVREQIGAEKTDALIFTTVASLDMVPSLAELAEVTMATADAMEAAGTLTAEDRAIVQRSLEGRGLVGCERVVPLDSGEARLAYSGNGALTATAGGSIAPIHYRIDVPADATRLTLTLAAATAGNPDFLLYTRTGAPVRFVASRRPPVIAMAELDPDARGRVVLTRETETPLPRCETLYVAVAIENLRTLNAALYTVQAELETTGVAESCEEPVEDAGLPPTDAGVSADGGAVEPGGGCGCRAAGSGSAPLAALALLGLGLAIRRRRPR